MEEKCNAKRNLKKLEENYEQMKVSKSNLQAKNQ